MQRLDLYDTIVVTMLHMGTSCGQYNSKTHLEKGVKINQPMHHWHQDLLCCMSITVVDQEFLKGGFLKLV